MDYCYPRVDSTASSENQIVALTVLAAAGLSVDVEAASIAVAVAAVGD